MKRVMITSLFAITISSILFVLSQNAFAHPVFTDPFTLNYTTRLQTTQPVYTTIYIDSESKKVNISIASNGDATNKMILLNEGDEHDLRDIIGDGKILDMTFTDSYCYDICSYSSVEIKTPTVNKKLEWTSFSNLSLRNLNSLGGFTQGLMNNTNGIS